MKNQNPETNPDLIDFASRCGDGRLQAKIHNSNLYNLQDIGQTVNGGVKRESLKGWNNNDAPPAQQDDTPASENENNE